MIESILWVVSFLSLFLVIFWIHIIFLKDENEFKLKGFPKVSIVVPAYNEEKTISKTINSLLKLDYPKDKLQIIVVNDESTDNTYNIVKKFKGILLLNNKHKGFDGKASAFNKGLERSDGDYVGCLDADSEVNSDVLLKMLPAFEEKQVGAVISTIKLSRVENIYEGIQKVEYILSNFSRKLMSRLDTLHVTPGALSLYRTDLLKQFGGFDLNNLTEDFEIAMRLRSEGYLIRIVPEAISYTRVPNTFKTLWNQRVRWFRGFFYNTSKYKHLIMSKKHGLFGGFQMPLNVFTAFIIILMFSLMIYEFVRKVYNFVFRLILLKGEVFYIDLPSVKQVIYNMNLKLLFPIFVAFLISLYMLNKAHKNEDERLRFTPSLILYFTLYPILRSLHWASAFFQEVFSTKKKW
ncbi:MAG: glycosyltransferase family 2 protein [Nanoarchaeota archaeon]|nr:glycosyltransferase family 2 protein [Nanoarchaeota archaeon]